MEETVQTTTTATVQPHDCDWRCWIQKTVTATVVILTVLVTIAFFSVVGLMLLKVDERALTWAEGFLLSLVSMLGIAMKTSKEG